MQMRGLPNAKGQQIPKEIGKYFNTCVLTRTQGTGPAAKRLISTKPQGMIEVKTSNPLNVKGEYSLDTGLAELFADTNNRCRETVRVFFRFPLVNLENFLEVYFATELSLRDTVAGILDRLGVPRYVSAGNVPSMPMFVITVDEKNFTTLFDENFHGGKRTPCAVKILESSLRQEVVVLGDVS